MITRTRKTPQPPASPEEALTTFEVDDAGTLRTADYAGARTRAEFYEAVAGYWSGSPGNLVDAMDECEPLAWAVHSI